MSGRDREVLNALREHGDALIQPREIVHWAYFPTGGARANFVEAALQIGFKLDGTIEPSENYREFGARVSHIEIPGEEIMDRVTALLLQLAEQYSGEYDGWE